MGALAHLRVIEIGGGLAVSYAARQFGDLGADVLKVEPLRGDSLRALPPFLEDEPGPNRSGLFAYCNLNKRSICVDTAFEGGRDAVRSLLETADVCFLNAFPRLGPDATITDAAALHRAIPSLIVVAISPYGLTGPKRGWLGTDLTAHAASGIAKTTPFQVADPHHTPPLRPGGRQAEFTTGLAAAGAAMTALHRRRRSDRGSLVDVSMQETMASFTRMDLAWRSYDPDSALSINPKSRKHQPSSLWGLIRCKDGFFAFQASEQYQWLGLMRALGDPQWQHAEPFATPVLRIQNWEALAPLLEGETRSISKRALYERAQAEGVPLFPAYTVDEALDDSQFVEREVFVPVRRPDTGSFTVPANPMRYSATPATYSRDWPAIGEHTEEVLAPLLGPTRFSALREQGVIA